jgi:cell division protein FtsW
MPRRIDGARMFSFLHPGSDAANTGYQLKQSLIALGSGGWNGVGIGAGHAKWLFLPNAHTDFIFSIIGEETGFVGCLLVLGLFAGLGLVGFYVARRAPDQFGALLRGRITVWIVRPGRNQPSARSSDCFRSLESRFRSSRPAAHRW